MSEITLQETVNQARSALRLFEATLAAIESHPGIETRLLASRYPISDNSEEKPLPLDARFFKLEVSQRTTF